MSQATIWSLLRANDVDGLKEALAHHPEEINAFSGIMGGTLLHDAAESCTPDVLRLLVDLGFDVNLGGEEYGELPIVSAAGAAKVDNVKFLLSCGSDLDVNEPERNALYAAITAGRGRSEEHVMIRAPEVAELLLTAGLDYRKTYSAPRSERNAKAKADTWGAREIRDMIAAWEVAEASKAEPQLPFEAAYYKAVSAHDVTAVRDLCETFPERFSGSEPLYDSSPTAFGSWLHCAAVNSSPDVASYLIEQGEDIEARERGWTPICTAARNGNVAMVRFLLEAGAKLHLEKTSNPLLFAVNANSIEAARLLLDAGIDARRVYDFEGLGRFTAEGWARNQRRDELADVIAAYM